MEDVLRARTRNKLHVLHKLPTPYNDHLFRALDNDPDILLQVHHLWKGSSRRPWQTTLATGYPNRFMRPILGIDWVFLRDAIRERESFFMIGDWAHVPAVAAIIARILLRAPVALWVDTPQEHLSRPLGKRVLRRLFLRWLLRRVSVIFASGKPARRTLLAMGAREQTLADLQFVVDLDRPRVAASTNKFCDAALTLRSKVNCVKDDVVFCLSGTIDFAKKAQDLAIRAFAAASARCGGRGGLLVAGDGPQLSALKLMARQLGIENRVLFLGWLEPEQMDVAYYACDALLHPAHYDPFPLAILEAMSWSRAVVATDSSGSAEERITDGENGFLFPRGDFAHLVTILSQLISDPRKLRAMGGSARLTAETWPASRAVGIIKQEMINAMR